MVVIYADNIVNKITYKRLQN